MTITRSISSRSIRTLVIAHPPSVLPEPGAALMRKWRSTRSSTSHLIAFARAFCCQGRSLRFIEHPSFDCTLHRALGRYSLRWRHPSHMPGHGQREIPHAEPPHRCGNDHPLPKPGFGVDAPRMSVSFADPILSQLDFADRKVRWRLKHRVPVHPCDGSCIRSEPGLNDPALLAHIRDHLGQARHAE